MLVKDVMTTNVITVHRDTSLREAATTLIAQRISGLPVVDEENRVVGILSEADFLKAAGHSGDLRKLFVRVMSGSTSNDGGLRDTTVAAVMTSPARTIEPDRSISEAASRMGRLKVNRLPVVSEGRLVGIITRADVVGLYARPDRELRGSVAEALSGFEGVSVEGVRDGLAILGGEVSHQALVEAARLVVGQVEGVLGVDTSQLKWRRKYGGEE